MVRMWGIKPQGRITEWGLVDSTYVNLVSLHTPLTLWTSAVDHYSSYPRIIGLWPDDCLGTSGTACQLNVQTQHSTECPTCCGHLVQIGYSCALSSSTALGNHRDMPSPRRIYLRAPGWCGVHQMLFSYLHAGFMAVGCILPLQLHPVWPRALSVF